MSDFHTADHKPTAALYACLCCGRVTLRLETQGHMGAGPKNQIATTLPVKMARAMISKLMNDLQTHALTGLDPELGEAQ